MDVLLASIRFSRIPLVVRALAPHIDPNKSGVLRRMFSGAESAQSNVQRRVVRKCFGASETQPFKINEL